jgi:hypothetical protein
MQICVVFTWRCHRTRAVWQSERYGPDIQSCRLAFRRAVTGKGRVLYAKTHTGTKYANGGRFC